MNILLIRCEQRKRWEWEDVQAGLFSINLQSLNLQQIQQAGSTIINEINFDVVSPMTNLQLNVIIGGKSDGWVNDAWDVIVDFFDGGDNGNCSCNNCNC